MYLYDRFRKLSVYFLKMRISSRYFANKKTMANINDYVIRERDCENEFFRQGPFWHLCTPGERQEIIFKTDEDYKFGVTSSALALHEANENGHKVKLYAFAIMSNHIHELLSGSREDCLEYFRMRKAKLRRYLPADLDMETFDCQLIEIMTLKDFRNEVAYINRNGFVNNSRETPFSYEWSSGRYYFNPIAGKILLTKATDLKYREKQSVLKSRASSATETLMVFDGYVSPLCFCEIGKGEALFQTAHKYFSYISKGVEAYASIAKALGDRIFLNDEEMLSVAYRKSRELYNADNPKLLPKEQKLELARLMHYSYNASNAQVQRILKLDGSIVAELFPKAMK